MISLRDLHDLDVLFNVVVKTEEKNAVGIRRLGGKIGEKVRC